MTENIVIYRGTLEIVETFGGFCLYGRVVGKEDNGVMHIACMGDGLDTVGVNQDTMTVDTSYDPNDDWELGLAYGFVFDDD